MTYLDLKSQIKALEETGVEIDKRFDLIDQIYENLKEDEVNELLFLLGDVPDLQEEAETETYKIWDFALAKDPRLINYKTELTQRLHPVYLFDKGELIQVDYYSNYDGKEYKNLILSVFIEWIRDENLKLYKRIETRKWTLSEESNVYGNLTKTTEKYYSPQQSAQADRRRRENIINEIISKFQNSKLENEFRNLFIKYDDLFNAYVKTGDKNILNVIETIEEPIMNEYFEDVEMKIRDYLIQEIDI